MRETFEWQTEQEGESPPSTGSRPETAGRRRLLLLLIVGLGVGLAAFLLWRRAQQRVEDVTADMEEAVLSSHELALAAARDGDEELFASLLTTTDPQWAKAQETLLKRELLFGGAPHLLGWRPLGEEAELVNVALSPELEQAAVKTQRAYAVRTPESLTETIVLTQTDHYRREGTRWLLSPPGDEEGAGQRNFVRDYVTLDAPARDEALAGRLAADLDTLLADMCRAVVSCPAGFRAHIHLEGGPLSLVTLAQPEATLTAGRDLTLPAPSLVGRPTDEVGYRALFRGYARHVVAAVVAELVDYECCDHILFFQALLDRQLARLGLQPVPAPQIDYALLDQGVTLDEVRESWPVDEPGVEPPPLLYAFLDFLADWLRGAGSGEVAQIESALQSELKGTANFWVWVMSLPTEEERVQGSMTERWRRYVISQISQQGGGRTEAPENLDLLAACGDDNGVDVFRHDLAGDSWEMELEVRHRNRGPTPLLTPLRAARLLSAADSRAFFVSPSPARDGAYPWLVRPGREPLALYVRNDPERILIPLRADGTSSGEVVAMAQDLWGSDQARQTSRRYGLFDPERCSDGCSFEPFPGIPTWSPDGNEVMALHQSSREGDAYDRLLYLRHEDAGHTAEGAWEPLAEGLVSRPFWLDNETAGYLEAQWRYAQIPVFNATDSSTTIRRRVRGEREFRVQSVVTGQEGRVLAAVDLLEELGQKPPDLEMIWAAPHPLRGDAFLALAMAPEPGSGYLFEIAKPAGSLWTESDPEIRLLTEISVTASDWSLESLVSPGGRWLTFVIWGWDPVREEGVDRVWVYDLEEEHAALFAYGYYPEGRMLNDRVGLYDWSPDGEWLARLIDGAVDLFAPASETRMLIPHDFERCTSVAWITAE